MADDLAPPQAENQQALLLQLWLSPLFPVGAFAYSHGLERAAEARLITDRASLAAWIGDLVAHGSIRNDLIILTAAWHATSSADWDALSQIAELAAALHPSAERRLESVTQGGSFLDAIEAAWPGPKLSGWDRLRANGIAFPVAVAMSAANHGIALRPLLEAYATAFAGNLVSAAIRLSLIGQTDGQRILSGLLLAINGAASLAAASSLDDLGSSTWSADLCSLEHETQYTRLFRS
jgi:urease accessory protein